jgi:hypothetical protein
MHHAARLRGFLIAIVVLALSAGVVLGAKGLPTAAERGTDRATEAAGFEVPVAAGQQADEDESTPDEEAADDDEDESTPDDEVADAAWDNHGAMVSEAAHMETPEGFRNHGDFVSCVAHMDHKALDEQGELIDLASLTPEDCDEDEALDEEVTDEEATDQDGDEPEETAEAEWDNHGALVSAAAHLETPDGFRNHGHFVSCVAHVKDLAAAPADLSALTPEDCDQADETDPDDAEAEATAEDGTGGRDKAKDKADGKSKHKSKGGHGRGKGHNR